MYRRRVENQMSATGQGANGFEVPLVIKVGGRNLYQIPDYSVHLPTQVHPLSEAFVPSLASNIYLLNKKRLLARFPRYCLCPLIYSARRFASGAVSEPYFALASWLSPLFGDFFTLRDDKNSAALAPMEAGLGSLVKSVANRNQLICPTC